MSTEQKSPSKLKAKTPVGIKPGKLKMLIFGAPGVGKTFFSVTFPKPYFIDTEAGADMKPYQERLKAAGGVYMGQGEGSLVFSEVIEQVKALATEKHEYKTLIIDSITKLYQTCIAEAADALGSKDAFGASKKPAIANMRRLVNWIQRTDMNVLFVAHEIAEWGNDEKGNRAEIGKLPDIWDKISYELHLAIHVRRIGPTRTASVTKSRLEGFPFAASFPLTYEEFASRYPKEAIESASSPIVLATPEQVKRVDDLLAVLKISEEEIEKWHSKAGADSFTDYSTETIEKVITSLTKKIT
jgi:hypothetical protein